MAESTEEVGTDDSWESAIAAMEAELGAATPDDELFDLPSDGQEAGTASDDVLTEGGDGTSDDPDGGEADDFFSEPQGEDEGGSSQETTDGYVDVPKYGRLPLDEVVKGYMRMDHFTQSQQQVKELERQLNEKINADTTGNSELWQALKEDPQGTVAYLAAEVGLMDRESIQNKMREVQAVKLRPESDIEQMVQERLNEAVVNHPVVQDALRTRVKGQIDSQFAGIEQRVGRPLTERDRIKVMNFAAENGIGSLDVAFDALAARLRSSAADGTDDIRRAAPQKRTPAPARDDVSFEGDATDFDDAVSRAMAELQASGAI